MTTRFLETVFTLAVAAIFVLAGMTACNALLDLTDDMPRNQPLPDTPASSTYEAPDAPEAPERDGQTPEQIIATRCSETNPSPECVNAIEAMEDVRDAQGELNALYPMDE